MSGHSKSSKTTVVRRAVLAVVIVAIAVGIAFRAEIGTLCSMGYEAIAAVCPLGALSALLAGKEPILRTIVTILAGAVVIVLVGKAFCSWICPVPPLKSLLLSKKACERDAHERHESAELSLSAWKQEHGGCNCPGSSCASCGARRGKLDTRHAVLGGALLSTVIFGFPVFCLVCPVGLTIATIAAFIHLVQFNEVTWSLLVFPVIVAAELLLFRKWCSKICPISAILSLVSRANKTAVISIDHTKCLRDSEGQPCNACSNACPELIDPYGDNGMRPAYECIKCHRCADACPVDAITFPLVPRKAATTKAADEPTETPPTRANI